MYETGFINLLIYSSLDKDGRPTGTPSASRHLAFIERNRAQIARRLPFYPKLDENDIISVNSNSILIDIKGYSCSEFDNNYAIIEYQSKRYRIYETNYFPSRRQISIIACPEPIPSEVIEPTEIIESGDVPAIPVVLPS